VSVDRRLLGLVPDSIAVPCEFTDAVIVVALVVDDDTLRVVAPGLEDIKAALGRGSVELVRSYCEVWTRYLAQVSRRAAGVAAGPVEVPSS
jgi:hypothetical protein